MPEFILLLAQNPEMDGANSWWFKGRYEVPQAEDAVKAAFSDYFTSGPRNGVIINHRAAVTGPGITWQEFDIVLEAKPAQILLIEETEPSK